MAEHITPRVIIIGGPNGAGKSTSAPLILRSFDEATEFINADVIARGLSGLNPESVAIAAGEVMLRRLDELASQRKSFAVETTLAGRSLASRVRSLTAIGYEFDLYYVWVPSADMAIERVKSRVRSGGHSVPEATIRQRYRRGLDNFFRLYKPLASTWGMYDNHSGRGIRLIGSGARDQPDNIIDVELWNKLKR